MSHTAQETIQIGIYDAKTHLSELLMLVEAGGRVVITRHGRPVAELIPAQAEETPTAEQIVERLSDLRRP